MTVRKKGGVRTRIKQAKSVRVHYERALAELVWCRQRFRELVQSGQIEQTADVRSFCGKHWRRMWKEWTAVARLCRQRARTEDRKGHPVVAAILRGIADKLTLPNPRPLQALKEADDDENGEEKFPHKWNDEFLDLPTIEGQRQPSTNGEGMAAILRSAGGHYRVLYALLAGCGPLRAGEALGLEIDKHISDDCRTLFIEQKAKRGEIQPYLKTKNGVREVDLCSPLAEMLKEFIGTRTAGLLFHTSSGAQLLQTNTLRDSLHPVLKRLQHETGGFNIFRRYRMTHLEKSDCPEALKHFWSGHAPRHVSERYVKLLTDRQYRLQWAERIGLGFELPGSSRNGQLGQLLQFPKAG